MHNYVSCTVENPVFGISTRSGTNPGDVTHGIATTKRNITLTSFDVVSTLLFLFLIFPEVFTLLHVWYCKLHVHVNNIQHLHRFYRIKREARGSLSI